MRGIFFILPISVLLAVPWGAARDTGKAFQSFPEPISWKTTEAASTGIVGNVVCGPDSSIYYRPSQAYQNPLEEPLTVLSPDGKLGTIDLRTGTGLPGHIYVFAFNVDSKGKFYAVIRSGKETTSYLASYDKQGRFLEKAPLQEPVRPTFLFPMSDEQIVISGMAPRPAAGRGPAVSVTGLFDAEGHELKSLKLPDGDAGETVTPVTQTISNTTIEAGNARPGPDGGAYIFKASPTPKVQELDASGDVLRVLDLAPPLPGAEAFDFFGLSRGTIAVAYEIDQGPYTGLYVSLYNGSTGAAKATYLDRGKGILACSEGNSVIIMRPTADHHFALGRVAL
jgi:hypothetical protein